LIDPSKATVKIDLMKDISGKRAVPPIFHIKFMGGEPVQYWNTAFGKMEHEFISDAYIQTSIHLGPKYMIWIRFRNVLATMIGISRIDVGSYQSI
jgi:hypothetical protein